MKLHKHLIAAVLASLGLGSAGTHAADAQSGRVLYETHCGTCHYEKLHGRQKSVITSLAALKLEVAKWAAQTNRRFTAAELEDVVDYLNQSHYRLEKQAQPR